MAIVQGPNIDKALTDAFRVVDGVNRGIGYQDPSWIAEQRAFGEKSMNLADGPKLTYSAPFETKPHVPFDGDTMPAMGPKEFLASVGNGNNPSPIVNPNLPSIDILNRGESVEEPPQVVDGPAEENGAPQAGSELERVIDEELNSLDDGSLEGAMRMIRAFNSVFAKYENADAGLANQAYLFMGQPGRKRETEGYLNPNIGR